MIYDCFIFYNELDVLEIRLKYLYDIVDKFVIVESKKTFAYKDKKLIFEKNKDRFAAYSDKIIYVTLDDLVSSKDRWANEKFQRNYITTILAKTVKSRDDIVLISDVDEIPSIEAIEAYQSVTGIHGLDQKLFYFYLNYSCNAVWPLAKIMRYGDLIEEDKTSDQIRNLRSVPQITNGGWHFSYLGGVDVIVDKIESFSHAEFDTSYFKNKQRLENLIRDKKDVFDRNDYNYSIVNFDATYPATLLENLTKYNHLIYIDPPATDVKGIVDGFAQAEIIKSIAKGLKPNIYVELGIAKAETFNLIHPYVQQEAYAVDCNRGFTQFLTNVSNKLRPYGGTTQQFAQAWERDIRKEIDLIFIDADHKKESVVEDALNFYKWLKPDYGLMILHDSWPPDKEHTSSVYCSDCYLAKEILKDKLVDAEVITLPWEYGLTLIRKKGTDWRNGRQFVKDIANPVPVPTVSIKNDTQAITDIIIPSFGNPEYLKLAIESVERNTSNYRLIVVNSGDLDAIYYVTDLSREWNATNSNHLLINSVEPLSFAEAINKGLEASQNSQISPKASDVVLLNNDVIVGPGWLDHLRASPFDLTNPFSNCDAWIHKRYPVVSGVELKPYMSISEVDTKTLSEMSSPYDDIVSIEWVAFYATYIKREVLDAVGVLDTKFKNGGEDIDFCRRAVKQGFTCGFNYASWVFHFGGKTRLVDEEGNYLQGYRPEDEENSQYNKHKAKSTVVIHTGPAYESWNWETIHTTGIGGSETCAAYLAKHLVKNGYRCVIIGDCAENKEGTFGGVEYLHHTKFDHFKQTNYIDNFISSRRFAPLTHPIKNGKNYIWAHDIWLTDLPPVISADLTFICLSEWHQKFFCQHHNIDPAQTVIIGNGLDLSRYENTPEKDPNRLIYSSCPSRGLLTLLQMFPLWKKEFPDLSLHVYYGFDNWKKIIENRGTDGQLEHLKAIEAAMDQDGVHFHGRVSQKVLAEEQMKSALWVYPTEFRETYCITAIETMMAGAVPVCTNFMTPQGPSTLETTVPDGCGIKLANPDLCFEATKELLADPEKQEAYREAGKKYVKNNCGWEQTTQKWIKLFRKENPMSKDTTMPSNIITYNTANKPFKLAIGLPMLHPFVHYKFVNSYLGLQRPQGATTISLVGSLTALARNSIVEMAKSNGHFTHLLFLDTDMTFPSDTIKKLISHDKDIVSGLYFERYAPYRPMLRKRFEDGYSLVDYTQSNLVKCDALGAGCLLIKMEVFEKLSKPYFEYRLTQTGIKETFLSEDIVFCERARDAGFEIWCDTTIRCGHLISDYEITEANWDGSTEFKTQNWG